MARRLPYVLGIVGAAGLAAATLGACDFTDQTAEDTADLTNPVTAVRLDNDAGSVTLRGSDDVKKVTVHREIHYRGEKPTGRTYKVTGGTLALNACGDGCAVGYTVDLPAGLPVDGRSTAGAIRLTDMGRVAVHTTAGKIELHRVSGPVDVGTTSGKVTGTGLNGGRITARTTAGFIDLTATKPSDVRAETSNGGMSLVVPRGGYDVSAETSNGHKDIGVTNDPSAAHRLDLTTSNGAIEVKGA